MIPAIVGSVLRHSATAGGGAISALGLATEETGAMAFGMIMALAGLAVSIYKEKTRHDMELEVERIKRLKDLDISEGGV